MANVITHEGIVEQVDGSHVWVRIIQTSACSSCSAKGHCTSADSKEKIIEVAVPYAHTLYKVGDKVTIVGQTSMGMLAVMLAFFVPFVLFVVSLFIFMSISEGDELLSGLLALALLVPYYLVLWMNKRRLKNSFTFTLKSNK